MRAFTQQTTTGQHVRVSAIATPKSALVGRPFQIQSNRPLEVGVLQTRLAIGKPGDQYEMEADRFAEQVMRMPERQLQRACDCGQYCPKCQQDKPENRDEHLQVQRVASKDVDEAPIPDIVHDVLSSPGHPLDSDARAFMESRFHHDFGRVRVHTDAQAAESARAVNALAYTVGQDLVFEEGQYRPETLDGKRLLAHELTHVVQQGSSLALQRYTVPSSLACTGVVPWIRNNSPYAPEWAATKCNYQFPPNIPYNWKPLKDGTVEATVSADPSRTVSFDCPVDRPEWSPDERPNQAAEASAFSSMRTALDAHEAAHQKIGRTWKTTLETRYQALAFKVIVPSEKEAAAKVSETAKAQTDGWAVEAQKAQDAIDPFRGAVLSCP